jgi:hypothetical protein
MMETHTSLTVFTPMKNNYNPGYGLFSDLHKFLKKGSKSVCALQQAHQDKNTKENGYDKTQTGGEYNVT